VYPGRVVNITKFGAFVNILPGRDGLLHISKIGGGKRIDRVEDVFSLGDEVEVKVDDVDPNGKVSLSLASAVEIPDSAVSSGSSSGGEGGRGSGGGDGGSRESVSFEDAFDAEARQEFGDLGPSTSEGRGGSGGGGGGGGGGRGGERRRRR
jgi:polyribonucleotide nucleotidyltransferase